MKTKDAVTEPLYINLYNLDSTSSQESPYVLTSPRSLEACRKAGLKPVELLYKDLHEYQEELEGLSAEQVFKLYTLREQDRINNLDKCRAIRKDLTLRKDAANVLKENARPVKNEGTEKSREAVSRKAQLDKENTSRANAISYTLSRRDHSILPNSYNRSLKYVETNGERILHLTGGGPGSPTAEEAFNKKLISTSNPNRNKRSSINNKKRAINIRQFKSVATYASPLSSSPDCSTLSSSSTARHLQGHQGPAKLKATGTRNSADAHTCKDASRRVQSFSGLRSKTNNLEKKVTPNEITRKCISHNDRKGKVKCDGNNNSSNSGSTVTVSSLSLQRRKQVSFRYAKCTDDLFLSEHDRRILESMAFKKELERESQEFAYQAQRLWEQDREHRMQLSHAHETEWKEYVAEKRRYESERNAIKWEEIKSSLRKSQLLLEKSLREKDERSSKLRKQVEEQKIHELEDRSLMAAKRRAVVEAANCKMDLEAAAQPRSATEGKVGEGSECEK